MHADNVVESGRNTTAPLTRILDTTRPQGRSRGRLSLKGHQEAFGQKSFRNWIVYRHQNQRKGTSEDVGIIAKAIEKHNALRHHGLNYKRSMTHPNNPSDLAHRDQHH